MRTLQPGKADYYTATSTPLLLIHSFIGFGKIKNYILFSRKGAFFMKTRILKDAQNIACRDQSLANFTFFQKMLLVFSLRHRKLETILSRHMRACLP